MEAARGKIMNKRGCWKRMKNAFYYVIAAIWAFGGVTDLAFQEPTILVWWESAVISFFLAGTIFAMARGRLKWEDDGT